MVAIIIIKISADDVPHDRFHMLLEIALLVRIMDSIKTVPIFTAMALCITNTFFAKAYLLYHAFRLNIAHRVSVDRCRPTRALPSPPDRSSLECSRVFVSGGPRIRKTELLIIQSRLQLMSSTNSISHQ
jgi:hypothetical protein